MAISPHHGRSILPIPLSPLVGREREITAVLDLLRRADVRLLTLTGPGGVGKTRLALAVASVAAAEFADGVCFVPLASVDNPAFALPTVAEALGLQESGARSLPQQLVAWLRPQRRLLVLDNLEHMLAAGPEIADLLAACPDLKVLATSRAVLRVSGERTFPVPPLALPDDDSTGGPSPSSPIDVFECEAVRLLIARAEAVNPTFAPADADAPVLAAICRRLEGLPLAIELAAARSNVLAPVAVLTRLDQRLPLLTGGGRDQPVRLQTMRAAIAWSHDLLNPAEQALFRRLAVFSGGFTPEAADYVGGGGGEGAEDRNRSSAPADVLDMLTELVDKSLMQVAAQRDGEPRFAMLETIREFALEQLVASGEEVETRQAHARYFLRLVKRTEAVPWRAKQRAWFDRVQADLDNVRAALSWSMERGEEQTGLRLAVAMQPFWFLRGPLSEGRDWLERALALATPALVSPALRADLLMAAGCLAHRRLDTARAEALLLDCLAIRRAVNDKPGEANTLTLLGFVVRAQPDAVGAAACFEHALALCREVGRPPMPDALWGLALAHHRLGDDARAADLLEEALERSRQQDDAWGAGLVVALQAAMAQDRGDETRAVALAGTALATFWELGDERDAFGSLFRLACAAAMLKEAEPAARLFGAAERLRERLGIALHPDLLAPLERAWAAIRADLGEV